MRWCKGISSVKSDVQLSTKIRQSHLRALACYFAKAFAVVAFLAFAKDCSSILPAWILPVVFLIYAIPATIGSMYDVVTVRLHKQDLYNENGKLSHFNRRWFVWFGGFFVVYLVSAVLFVLQAPSWDRKEWLLIWATPFVFCVIFLFLQSFFKKEYSTKYYKARAIRWSVLATALFLTVLYAVIAAQSSMGNQGGLEEIIQNRYLAFEDSPAGLLAELDKLTTYVNCLTDYGIDKLANVFGYVVALIVSLVIGFSVFAGVASLFSACLLSFEEVMDEFRLLPITEGKEEPVQLRYLIILFALWVVLSGAFVWLNGVADEVRSTSEYTVADEWIDATLEDVISGEAKHVESAFDKHFLEKKEDFINQQLPLVQDEINKYYEACLANVDSYAVWYESAPIGAARIIPIVGESIVRDEFDRKVVDSVNREGVDREYEKLLNGLRDLYAEYWNAEETSERFPQIQLQTADGIMAMNNLSTELVLWPSWDSEEGKSVTKKVLLGIGGDDESSDIGERIRNYINERRNEELVFVEGLQYRFF